MPRSLSLFFIVFIVIENCFAQNFLNNDLNGTVAVNAAPTNWQIIPFTDPNCLATGTTQATPDILSLTGPQTGFGICGNPYSGTTFASGLYGGNGANLWHEGIMQTVNNLTVGCFYTIHFFQAVVKQGGGTSIPTYLDTTGSWSVYVDNTLAGTTAPTHSQAVFNSTSFKWDKRSVVFQATLSSHTIKFLPADDDNNQSNANGLLDGALRMGIDSIWIIPGVTINQNPTICSGNNYILPGGNSVSAAGTYIDTISSGLGCDSIIITNLTVINSFNTNVNFSFCNGSTYTLPGGNIVSTP